MNLDEDAVICDFAETYGIFDWRSLPLTTAAILAVGLRDDSRIKMKLSNQIVPIDTLIMSGILDYVALLVWSKTKDFEKGKNRPQSMVSALLGDNDEEKKIKTYSSGEEFERDRARILAMIRKGNNDGNGAGESICADNSIC